MIKLVKTLAQEAVKSRFGFGGMRYETSLVSSRSCLLQHLQELRSFSADEVRIHKHKRSTRLLSRTNDGADPPLSPSRHIWDTIHRYENKSLPLTLTVAH